MASGVAIDLGAHAVRAVELRVEEGGAVVRRAVQLDRKALRERGVDPQDRPKVIAALKREMDGAGIAARGVALAISGKESIIRYTHVPPVPAWRLQKIMEYEVGEVSEKIGEKLSSDHRVLPVQREDGDQAIVIGLAREPTLDALLEELRASGISVAKAIPAPVALLIAYLAFGKKADLENPEDELVVVIDIGAENLNLAFLLNGNPVFARGAAFGGRNFTEAIARDLGISLDEAEAIKLRGGTLELGGGGRREETVNPLRGAAIQLLSLVQSTLRMSTGQIGLKLPDPARYVLLGGAAALPGLAAYLQNGLKRPVEEFRPPVKAGGEVTGEAAAVLASHPGNYAVPLGLAASLVRREGFELSLLPERYRERRLFRERTLFLYLAAGFLLAFLAARTVQAFLESSETSSRTAYLKKTRETLEGHRARMLENQAENSRTRARIDRILREAEIVPFQAFFLDFLGRRAGTEVKVLSLKLALQVEADGQSNYSVEISGAADNATQRANERIHELETALRSDPRVLRVETPSVKQIGNWYEFQMIVHPSYPVCQR